MISMGRSLAIALRIVRQVRRDHRSLALIIVAPVVVMSLVGFSLFERREILDNVAPALLAVFAFFFVFILTGVSFLRERAQGTLERLLTTPVSRADILLGYLLGFLLFATVQTLVILLFTVWILQVEYRGDLWQVMVLLLTVTVVGENLGIFISTFARNEFQVVQFIPLVLAPQIFLSGLILPVEELPGLFQAASSVLPLTYSVEGLREIMLRGGGLGDVVRELAVLLAFAVGLLVLASATVRRRG